MLVAISSTHFFLCDMLEPVLSVREENKHACSLFGCWKGLCALQRLISILRLCIATIITPRGDGQSGLRGSGLMTLRRCFIWLHTLNNDLLMMQLTDKVTFHMFLTCILWLSAACRHSRCSCWVDVFKYFVCNT